MTRVTPFEDDTAGVGVGSSGEVIHSDGVAGPPDEQADTAKTARASTANLYLVSIKSLVYVECQRYQVNLNSRS